MKTDAKGSKRRSVLRWARGVAGFSLIEMLVTTLILGLASTLMATGIPAAIDTYHKVVNTANAQVALSMTALAIRTELNFAERVEQGSDETVLYYQSSDGWVKLENSQDLRVFYGLQIVPQKGDWDSTQESTGYGLSDEFDPKNVSNGPRSRLITNEVITDALRVSFDRATIEKLAGSARVVCFENLKVIDGQNKTLAKADSLRVLTRFAT